MFKILPEKIPEKVRESKLTFMFASNPNTSMKYFIEYIKQTKNNPELKNKREMRTNHSAYVLCYKKVGISCLVGVQICRLDCLDQQ